MPLRRTDAGWLTVRSVARERALLMKVGGGQSRLSAWSRAAKGVPVSLDIEQLIDPDQGLISPKIFADEEVFRLELDRLFSRSWLFLAHESQLKKPGDFFNTYMGLDPVLVVRQRDDSIKAFINACRHRGMSVCRADFGNAKSFTCPYHGWIYGLDGELVQTPRAEAFNEHFNRQGISLVSVARLESYRGLLFGTFDETAPPLVEYLGDMTFYIDACFDRLPGGVEVIGPMKWEMECNWKWAAEQFTSDMYHTYNLHISPFVSQMPDLNLDDADIMDANSQDGRQFSSPYGHGSGWYEGGGFATRNIQVELLDDYWRGVMPDVIEHSGAARARMESHNNVFPTFSFLYPREPTVRVWHPKSPNRVECWSWAYVDAGAPEKVKNELRRWIILNFSPSGMFEQDDGEAFLGCQRNARGHVFQQHPLHYQAGLGSGGRDDEYPGRVGYVINEMAARGFYRWYRQLLSTSRSEPFPVPPPIAEPPVSESAREEWSM